MYYGDADYDDNYLPENDRRRGSDADGIYEDFDDGIVEGLIIIGLAGALIFLMYWRQQHQLAHRRDADAARMQNGDVPEQPPLGERGLFPQPGDPEFGQWVAGGVGH